MSDPVSTAWKYSDSFFKDLLRAAVPERRAEVDDFLNRHAIKVIADEDEGSMEFSVDPVTHEITVATSPLPRIWGHAYAYLSVYTLVSNAKALDPKARSVSVADGQFAVAMAILKWAMAGDAKAIGGVGGDPGVLGPQAYPAGLGLPFDPMAGDKMHKAASDLVLMALGFILLHEIAHLELKHPLTIGADSIVQEREADAWAAAFLLDKCDEYARQHGHATSAVRMKRLLAITMGELWMLHFEVHLGVKDSRTHPPTYDRLANLLDQQANGGGDVAWAMAATILPLHYQARYGAADERGGFDDFPECYQFYADLLSKKPKRGF